MLSAMRKVAKKILEPSRLRHIDGGFSFIPHRFLTDGFLASLTQTELLFYLFLVLVSDRYGLSFYSYDSICSLLQLSVDDYMEARDGLMEKDLIAFDGTLFQVLDLPSHPVKRAPPKPALASGRGAHPSHLARLIRESLKEVEYD